jgi:hypothetical protein
MMDYQAEAQRLLENYQREINTEFNAKDRPELRNRIAAALQAAGQRGADEFTQFHHNPIITQLRAENERLKGDIAMLIEQSRVDLNTVCLQRDALHIERDSAIKSHCSTCDGSGVVDSGGVTPWDAPVDMACPECKAKHDAAVVQGLEIAAKIFQYHRHRLRGVSADAFAICADMRDAIAAEIAKRKEPAC